MPGWPTWDKFDVEVGTKPNRDISLTFLRDGQTLNDGLSRTCVGKAGSRSVTSESLPDSYADGHRRSSRVTSRKRAGFKPGDLLLGSPTAVLMTQPSRAHRGHLAQRR